VLVRAVATDDIAIEEVESWVSFRYTEKEPRPAVRYRYKGALPATFVTLLVPYEGVTPPSLSAAILPATDQPGTVGLRVDGGVAVDTLLAGDGQASLLRTGPDGRELRRTSLGHRWR